MKEENSNNTASSKCLPLQTYIPEKSPNEDFIGADIDIDQVNNNLPLV